MSLCSKSPVLVVIALFAVAPAIQAESIESILESRSLTTAYNPVLLDYLLEEGRDDLPALANSSQSRARPGWSGYLSGHSKQLFLLILK